MVYVVYTNTENMSKSIEEGIIRIPQNLIERFNLKILGLGDNLLLFNYEEDKLYGILRVIEKYRKELNPKTGPFNGYGKVKNHYYYYSIKVDPSDFKRTGVDIKNIPELDLKSFSINSSVLEEKITETLVLINERYTPLIIELKHRDDYIVVSVLNVKNGIIIVEERVNIDISFIDLVKKKTGDIQRSVGAMNFTEFLLCCKDLGDHIYEVLFKHLKLEELFQTGGYSISFIPDNSTIEIPLEFVHCCDSFLFEKNSINYMRKNKIGLGREVIIHKVLIIADPGMKYRYSYEEGRRLFKYFSDKGVQCDFLARPISDLNLISILGEYQLVHITGHGESKNFKNENIISFDIGWSMFQLKRLNNLKTLPNFFFFNICSDSLKWGFDLLKNKDIGNVILSRWSLPDVSGLDFILNFYELLFNGLEIGRVFSAQKLKSLDTSSKKDLTPFLFSHLGEATIRYVF